MSPLTDQASAIERLAAVVAHRCPLTPAELQEMHEHPYIVVGKLVRWLVENRASLSMQELKDLFDEVERQARDGTDDVRELLAEGFVEDLQSSSSAEGLSDGVWLPLLGHRTARMWRLIQDVWSGRVTPEDYRRLITS